MAQKLFRLSVGQESQPTQLVPEGGLCAHGNEFDIENPKLVTQNAQIITGSLLLGDISVFKLETGKWQK